MTLCEKCIHGDICADRNCHDEDDERAMTYCDDFINKDDVVEVKHGKWIDKFINLYGTKKFIGFRCTSCDLTNDCKSNYCPNCGAKMDGQTPQKLNHNSLCETETYKVDK